MRPIDGDALKDHLEDLRSYTKLGEPDAYYRGETNALKVAIGRIDRMPTVDAVPVKHGRWIEYPECLKYDNAFCDEDIVCSECGQVWNIIDNDTNAFKYCPNCGARMDEKRRQDDAKEST